jgi:hypothetical protein
MSLQETTAPDLTGNNERFNFCFIDPAMLPAWFWLPTAHCVEQQGHDYFIPNMRRGDSQASAEEAVDSIEETMQDKPLQFIIALSRGVEFGVRYIDRLAQQKALSKIMGWMVISSVGPRGYEVSSSPSDEPYTRHTALHTSGLSINQQGLEVIDPEVATASMLHDIDDERLLTQVLDNLVADRPLSQSEINSVPHVDKNTLPVTWYIGLQDKVDNIQLSAAVAKRRFGVTPHFTDWGHVGPLSHTQEVSNAILDEARRAYILHGRTT